MKNLKKSVGRGHFFKKNEKKKWNFINYFVLFIGELTGSSYGHLKEKQ